MKRIHLFEFEDFSWFPSWLRKCMTRYIMVIHQLLESDQSLAKIISNILKHNKENRIIDLCSGSGGPMLSVHQKLTHEYNFKDLKLTLSDLYPDPETVKIITEGHKGEIEYKKESINAANVEGKGLRTMICSMHHMPPKIAFDILKDAHDKKVPICIFEISDNSFPIFLWWVSMIPAFLMTLLLTPRVKPLTWYQLFFTYIIPIIPLFIAWDGAVSNARTYTKEDLKELTTKLQSDDYNWDIKLIKAKGPGNMICLTGTPKSA